MFYIDPYRIKPLKLFLSETRRPRSLIFGMFFFCVEVLRSSQSNGVMSSAVSLTNRRFTGQA